MKNALLNAYKLLFRAAADYGLERDARSIRAGYDCHTAAMEIRRILNAEVVVNNDSMTREEYCLWKASELVQFQEAAPQVSQTLEQWDEQMEAWLVNP